MSACDNKSVGVIIKRDDGAFAVIKRKNYPVSYAFVAGHLDGDTPEEAAKKESREEAHIDIKELKELLHKTFQNPCKRPGGSFHEWYIFEAADWAGELKSGSDAKETFFVSPDELKNLIKKTESFSQKSEIPLDDDHIAPFTEYVTKDPDWQKSPGFEPVWVLLLKETETIDF